MMAARPWTASKPTGVPQYYGVAATRMYENPIDTSGSLQAVMPASIIKTHANSNSMNVYADHNAFVHVNTIQTRQASSSTQSSIASSPEFPNPNRLVHQSQQNQNQSHQHVLPNQWAHHAYSSAVYPNPNLNLNSNPTLNNSSSISVAPKRDPRDLQGVEFEDNDDDFFEVPEHSIRRFSGACRQCKKLKTKCEFIPEINMCRRCKVKERICVFEGRKKTEHKHEVLLARLRDKEATIDALLQEIKKRGIVPQFKIGDFDSLNSNTASHKDTPPNQNTQTWIQKLYERYPPDANNDWTAPSTELQGLPEQQQVRTEREREREDAAGSGSGSSSGSYYSRPDPNLLGPGSRITTSTRTRRSSMGAEDVEYEEGDLPQLHPILVHHLPSMPVPVGYIADLRRRRARGGGSGSGGEGGNGPLRDSSEGGLRSDDDEGNDGRDHRYKDGEDVDADENEDEVGVAHSKYFNPGPASDIDQRRFYIEREPVPDMLLYGLITLDDVDELFKIYFQRMNAFVSILDPVLHTPANTFSRSPFLFTVICAIASRYYTPRRAIYKYAMHLAKVLAGSYLVNGWKTVELCQAYILLSTFSMPAKKWEEDRSRLYLELAIRIALDLNIHRPLSLSNLPNEKYERESLNRTRAWLNCYNLDCSMSTLLGRPAMLSHDIVSPDMTGWYTRSRYNHPYDVHLCAYTEALRLMCRFHEAVRGDAEGKRDLRFYKRVTLDFNDQLEDVHARIAERYNQDSDKNDSGCVFRTGLLPLVINYYRLVMFSFGFQQAVDQGALQRGDIFFQNCFDAACAVITSMIDILAPMGYMRFSPDGYFVFTAFAAAFLLKLLRPDFAKIVKRAHKDQISTLVRKLIRFLGSAEVTVDEQHTPKLYSRFLSELMAKLFSSAGLSSTRSKSAVGADRKKINEQQLQQDQNQDQDQSNADHGAGLMSTTDFAAVHPQPDAPQWNGQQNGDSVDHVNSQMTLQSDYIQKPTNDGRYISGQTHGGQAEPQQYPYPSRAVDEAVFSDGQQHAQPQSQSQLPQYQYREDVSVYPQAVNIGTGLPLRNVNANANANANTNVNTNANVNANTDVFMTDDTMSLPALTTEEYILSMQAINNPRWWENVMMPGFSWPVHSNTSAYTNTSPVAVAGVDASGVPSAMDQVHGHGHVSADPASASTVGSYQYQQVQYDSSGKQPFPGQRFVFLEGGGAHPTGGGEGGEQQQMYYSATQQQQQQQQQPYPSAVDLIEAYHPADPNSAAYQFVGQPETNSY